ncbi:MAG: SpoIIE family protein phosphatase [Candidatus Eisenbacteria bacterium]|nr:SpoIIE family protein phosphatase [Candidatus Eisenbacteria bacterium]
MGEPAPHTRRREAMRQILREAIQRETDAFNYYQKARARAHVPESEALLLQLAEEERKHRAILLEELRKLERLLLRGSAEEAIAAEHVSYHVPEDFDLRRLQSTRGLDLAAVSLPMEMIGGDFLDTVPLTRPRDGRALGLFLYDIMGHGLESTRLKALAKRSFTEMRESWASRRGPVDLDRPEEVLSALNQGLIDACQSHRRFVTALYCVVDPIARTLTYASAGHETPIVIRANGEYIHLSQTQLLLCVTRELTYDDVRVPIEPGDVLALYSDGITEAMGAAEEMFGRARVRAVLQRLREEDAATIARGIVEEMRGFLQGEPMTDEATLVVIKVEPDGER